MNQNANTGVELNKQGGDREDFFRAIAESFMISADLTHAVHPNAGEKRDPQNRPLINKGPVIKISAKMRYTTDSSSSTTYAQICTKAGVLDHTCDQEF